MITSYKFDPVKATICPDNESAEWFDLENPDPDELKITASRFNLPLLFLADPLDPKERPRLDQEDGAILIVIRIPRLTSINEKTIFDTVPLGLVLTKNIIITICREHGMSRELLGRGSRKARPFGHLRMAFKIFSECSADFIRYLGLMEEMTDEAELNLSRSQQNEQIMTLMTIEKALINYTVALKSNRGLMEKLMEGNFIPLSNDDADLLEYALTENQQAIFMADIFGQVLGSMSDAFGTIISNNLNKVMKFLTGVTIVLMVPTLVVGAYGMNVVLPMAEHPLAFWILTGLCLLSCLALWIFFRCKKWI